jgi:hypothetical protein
VVKRLNEIAGFQLAYLSDDEIKAVADLGFLNGWLAENILKSRT